MKKTIVVSVVAVLGLILLHYAASSLDLLGILKAMHGR
jgi:hypothetical protein